MVVNWYKCTFNDIRLILNLVVVVLSSFLVLGVGFLLLLSLVGLFLVGVVHFLGSFFSLSWEVFLL